VSRLLVVTAVDAERDAISSALEGVPLDLVVGGVGPAEAAASAATALATGTYDLVISAGIAGGFAPMRTGDLAVASTSVFADLGIETEAGFVPVSALGFGNERYEVTPRLAAELVDITGGHMGTILTVTTATGTDSTATRLREAHPDAIAEAMEGAGVAAAARAHGVPFAEVRAISNAVGARDPAAWDIPAALRALGAAVAAIAADRAARQ